MTEKKKQSGVVEATPDLKQLEEVLNAREKELDAKEEVLNAREKELNAKEESKKDIAPKEGLQFEFRGEQYKFADGSPELIRFGGESLSQEEIAKDEDTLVLLIGGGSGLIEKL